MHQASIIEPALISYSITFKIINDAIKERQAAKISTTYVFFFF